MVTFTEKARRRRDGESCKGQHRYHLIARSTRRLEAEQLEYLLHGDLGAKLVEVDTWHGVSLCVWSFLAGEHQALFGWPQIEIGVSKGMDVTGAAESLTGGDSAGGVLARVMHQHDREVQPPLQQAEVGQQFGCFGRADA